MKLSSPVIGTSRFIGSASEWRMETRRYDRPHPRLVRMASVLRRLPARCVLDVGCSTAQLRRLLPDDWEYYGCDIADHALESLGSDHFRCVDLNRSCDLSWFANRGIEAIHIGGVLEYLERPGESLRSLRELVPAGSPLVLSIINFESDRHAEATKHHPWWIYKPRLPELRSLLTANGWQIERQLAFTDRSGLRRWLVTRRAAWHGPDHPWTRRHAAQFILAAQAR